jgi:hypothetical protein
LVTTSFFLPSNEGKQSRPSIHRPLEAVIHLQLRYNEKIAQVRMAFFGTRKRVASRNRVESIQSQLICVAFRSFRKSHRDILPEANSLNLASEEAADICHIQQDPNGISKRLSR